MVIINRTHIYNNKLYTQIVKLSKFILLCYKNTRRFIKEETVGSLSYLFLLFASFIIAMTALCALNKVDTAQLANALSLKINWILSLVVSVAFTIFIAIVFEIIV